MYNILIALTAGALTGALLAALIGWLPAVLPALIVAGFTMYFLARRTNALVQAEMEAVVPLLQGRQIEPAKAQLRQIQKKYGRWQLLLDGQLQSQLGLIDYLQLKFDDALPQLEKGKFQNWMAQACIACIHYRKARKDQAWSMFRSAAGTAPKEAMVFVVWATLLTRDGDRPAALAALDEGLKSMPDSQLLKTLRNRIANKKPIQVKDLPETWYQFFPEELAQQMMMRGKRGVQPNAMPQPKLGARHAPRR